MQPGEKVRLKSGGPLMTVESVETVGGKAMVHCVWFDNEHNERRASYAESALVEDAGAGKGRVGK
jgi:uncharacterized protein YodC (DUF2158 family)